MDIYIKSFNRVYYLDRCIHSIYAHAKGDFKIKVLDDGTPRKFLNKLQEKYPAIVIAESPFYEVKSQAVQAHVGDLTPYNISGIPDKFWFDQIKRGSDIFLLLEDDIWLTHNIELLEIETIMKAQRMSCVKMYWGGNKNIVQGDKISRGTLIEELVNIPFPIRSPKLFRFFIFNQLKLRSVAKKLGFWDNKSLLPYYTIYSVAGAFFEKKYWLYLWENSGGIVNELNQLTRALAYAIKNEVSFGKLVNQGCNTSYITSTSNIFSDIKLDFMKLNYCLNEAWHRGELTPSENLPEDFSSSYLEQFLSDYPQIDINAWRTWITAFKDHYKSLGFKIS